MSRKDDYPIMGGVYIAVFNARADDEKAARKAVLDKFGPSGWRLVLERRKGDPVMTRKGRRYPRSLMNIFSHRKIPETDLYVRTIADRVEARAVAAKPSVTA